MNTKQRMALLFSVVLLTALTLLVQTRQSIATVEGSEAPKQANSAEAQVIQSAPQAQSDEAGLITHGPISGEVTDSMAVLWARGSVTGTLNFEVAEDANFDDVVATASVEIDGATDFTGEVLVEDLEPGQAYTYQATLTTAAGGSEAVVGQFSTAPAADEAAAFDFVFGGDIGGQGFCRNPDTGWEIFNTVLAEEGDFFLLTGDSVYVDDVCGADDNVPGAEGPYADLDGFRTRYRYHLEDPHYAEFLAQTPVYVTWDDHEIVNDFGGPALSAINPQRFAAGQQAYFDYWPLMETEAEPYRLYRRVSRGAHADFFILDSRSYRDPNVNWDPNPTTLAPKTMLGPDQFAWLQRELEASEATWKFIVSSVPLAYPTGFPQPQVDGRDGWANYSERSGYETELAAIFFYLMNHNIENVVFISGDVHWPFALSYDPDRDREADFHEISAGPISAITLPPADPPDPTFNPTVLYAEGEFLGGLFNFGQVSIAEDGELTFRVVDQAGDERYALTLSPEAGE